MTPIGELAPVSTSEYLPKRSKWKRTVLIIAGAIILLAAIIFSLPNFLGLFTRDIAPINDADILLKKVSVPDNQNAYFDLIKLDEAILVYEGKFGSISDMAAGKTWDEAAAEEIVSNTQAFGYFTEAAKKLKFQNPDSADPANITPRLVFHGLATRREMARLSAIRAMYLAKQGRDKEAMEEALNSAKIGQKIQESQVLLIDYLVGSAMKGVGLETVHRIAVSSKLNSAELSRYAQELGAFYKNEDGLINSFKGEYTMAAGITDALSSGSKEALEDFVGEGESENQKIAEQVKNSYYYQPNKTKLLFAELARENIKSVNQPCGEIKTDEIIPMLAPTSSAMLYVEENAVGKILHDVMAVGLTGFSIRKCEEDILVAATQAILAIKAFKNDRGNYPTSLSELVPRYLASVPVDPFDGRALKYSSGKKVVYSVGQDGQDSGGSIGDDWRKMADPTFKIGF